MFPTQLPPWEVQAKVWDCVWNNDVASLARLMASPEHGSMLCFPLLHRAAQQGAVEVGAWLVSVAGVYVDSLDHDGDTPLLVAAWHGRSEFVRMLLENGANPLVLDRSHGRLRAIHWAAQSSVACVALLVESSVHATTGLGRTALHYAAFEGFVDVMALLIDNGGDVNALDVSKHTPLWAAFKGRQRSAAEFLLESGAHLNLVVDVEWIPSWAISFGPKRKACLAAAWALLETRRRRSKLIGQNGRDALQIIARLVWLSRQHDLWHTPRAL